MEDTALHALWQSYDARLATSLQLHRQNAAALTHMQARGLLASMRPIKVFAVLVGLLWVLAVDGLLVATFPHASVFFLVSMGLQSLLTKLAIGVYLYQLALIRQVDVSGPVRDTQARLARLQASTLAVTRILFLQLPLWTTFYLSLPMLAAAPPALLALQVACTVAFGYAAWWLFRNIRIENRDRRWFRWLFQGKEWTPMVKAMEMLAELEGEG
jgi:hypothetical protein